LKLINWEILKTHILKYKKDNMKYEFTTKAYGQEGMYGVKYESLNDETKALFQIAWWGWTTLEIQVILDKAKSLSEGEEYDYQVSGSDLLISIDKESVYFFDANTKSQEEEDFKWDFAEFISFMEEFKIFIEANR
jgi:hypothetical protein